MLSFIVRSFLIFYIYKKRELLYFALLWTASHGAFTNLLLCQSYTFLWYLLFYRGKTKFTNLFSVRHLIETYIQHMLFASLVYTNWLISNQKQSSTLYTKSAFISAVCVQVLFRFILVVNSFVVGLFIYFFNLSLFEKVHVMVLLCIWRAVFKDQLVYEACILKPVVFGDSPCPKGFYCITPCVECSRVESATLPSTEDRNAASRAGSIHYLA